MGTAKRGAPVGVFDSGLGGLTVVRAIRARSPAERIVYLGDTARVPYGTRSPSTVLRYARGCARHLTERGIKALVIACNTASAVAVDLLRAELDLPVMGVVEPGARAAARLVEGQGGDSARSGRIGVLGTASTIASGAYPRAVAAASTRAEVVAESAPLLVPLVEEGWLEGDVPRLAVERYVRPLVDADISALVLGCTHYPLLKPLIMRVAEQLAGRPLAVVDSAEATAEALEDLLVSRDLDRQDEAPPSLELLVTDLPASFRAVAERFLGETLPDVAQIDL